MVTEVGVVRLGSPVLGASQPVWATAIAAVLAALAVGNALGGRLAERAAGEARVLSALLLAAGVAIVALPWLLAAALAPAVGVDGWAGPALGLVVLGVASALPALPLGVLTPILIRGGVRRLDEVGESAGRVQMWGTIGALVGTLGSTFLLTPWVGSSRTFVVTGACVAALGVAVLLRRGPARASVLATAALVVLVTFGVPPARSGSWSAADRTIARVDSPYTTWEVREDAVGIRRLLCDDGHTVQSYLDPEGELQTGSWPVLAAAPLLAAGRDADDEASLFLIGLGGGTVAREALLAFPRSRVLGVELDAAAISLGRAHLDLPDDPRLRVVIDDGRVALARETGPFDAVVVDAYRGAYVPPHLATRELFEAARARLAPGGVLALNLIGPGDGPLVAAFVRTAAEVFPAVHLLDVDNGLNVVLIAGARSLDGAALAARARRLARPSLARHAERTLPALIEVRPDPDAVLLTDDHAPVAWLTHRLALARLARGGALR